MKDLRGKAGGGVGRRELKRFRAAPSLAFSRCGAVAREVIVRGCSATGVVGRGYRLGDPVQVGFSASWGEEDERSLSTAADRGQRIMRGGAGAAGSGSTTTRSCSPIRSEAGRVSFTARSCSASRLSPASCRVHGWRDAIDVSRLRDS